MPAASSITWIGVSAADPNSLNPGSERMNETALRSGFNGSSGRGLEVAAIFAKPYLIVGHLVC